MKVIHKYEITPPKKVGDPVEVMMPPGAWVLHADTMKVVRPEGGGIQSALFVWASVGLDDRRKNLEPRKFFVFPTGAPFNEEDKAYVGTVLMREEGLVWHVYEEAGPSRVAIP